jgi:hypothetical protein
VRPAINSKGGRDYIQRIERRIAHLNERIRLSPKRPAGNFDAAERNALEWALDAIDELDRFEAIERIV